MTTRAEVFLWMRSNAHEYAYGQHDRAMNLTQLAEAAAHWFDRDEWLDDPDHFVWDLAMKVAMQVAPETFRP